MTTPLIGRLFVLPAVLLAPESPAEHIRNALAVLIALKQQSPAFWGINPELGRATRRAQAALVLVETHAPLNFTLRHLHGAVQALVEAALDWDIVCGVPAACARLVQAWFMLQSAS